MGWLWPGILIPIGLFLIGVVWLPMVISGEALDIKQKQNK